MQELDKNISEIAISTVTMSFRQSYSDDIKETQRSMILLFSCTPKECQQGEWLKSLKSYSTTGMVGQQSPESQTSLSQKSVNGPQDHWRRGLLPYSHRSNVLLS